MKYRRRPPEIDAVRVTDDCAEAVAWLKGHGCAFERVPDGLAVGDQVATPGDWIVRDEHGVICVCSPCVFNNTYEAVI